MNRLWAPWRLQYVRSARIQSSSCFFCRYKRQRKDAENLVVHRTSACLVVLNRFPYNTGHLMVAPLAHKGTLEKLTREEMIGLMELTRDMQKVLDRVMKPHGYNIGINLGRIAGAGLPGHLHIHVVPRWSGDTNFMPVTGGAKVMSQSLKELYRQMKEKLRP